MVTVLFISPGSQVELLNCFRQDAAELKLPLRALAADAAPEFSVACQLADKSFRIRRGSAAAYVAELLNICTEFNVDLIVPCADAELEILVDARGKFAAIGARVHASKVEVIRMARNRLATGEWLQSQGISTPKAGSIADVLSQPEEWRWPLVLRPIDSGSSEGKVIVDNRAQLEGALPDAVERFVEEFVGGREFTVHLFFDQSGALRYTAPLLRKEVQSAEVSTAITWRHPSIMELAEQLGTALKDRVAGALCFQAILTDEGEAFITQIEARFGDAFALAHRAEGKFSRWLLEEVSGQECSANDDDWRDQLMMLRYGASLFLPAPDEEREATLFWLNPGPPV